MSTARTRTRFCRTLVDSENTRHIESKEFFSLGLIPLAALQKSIAQPPIAAVLPGFGTGPGFEFGLTVALPPTDVVIPNFGSEAGAVQGISIAQPPTQLVIPSFADSSGIDLGTTVAEPTTKVRIETE